MLTLIRTNQFKKDVKRSVKRDKNMNKLKIIMMKLANQEILDYRHRDHVLVGSYAGRRECHIEPDWLLIYKLEKNTIIFERIGTHADLFE